MSISEEGRGKLRAQKPTWPCSQFCLWMTLQTRVFPALTDGVLKWGLRIHKQMRPCYFLSLSRALYTFTLNIKRAAVFLPTRAMKPLEAAYIQGLLYNTGT